MSSASRRAGRLVVAALFGVAAVAASPPPQRGSPPPPSAHDPHHLSVCADPNNLPFSNAHAQGFENEIAALVARDLGRRVRYVWAPQRRGFIRTTLAAGRCDLVVGVPPSSPLIDSTRPYYRSRYVFVSRHDRALRVRSFDDPRLPTLLVGIPITGQDYGNPPPAQALASRHLADNVRGYMVYGDYAQPAPQRTLIDAVADGRVDIAAVWGPVGGYFAARSPVRLDVTAVDPDVDRFSVPFAFDISMGVRRGAEPFRRQLDDVLAGRRREIDSILKRYGVPLVDRTAGRSRRRHGAEGPAS